MGTLTSADLWLHAHCVYAPAGYFRLLEAFGTAEEALRKKGLWGKFLPKGAITTPPCTRLELERAVEQAKLHCLSLADPDYPAILREIADPPPLLYLRGKRDALLGENLAVVGARRASPYGIEIAGGLGESLASSGLCVVSGGARGIDTAAHQGALAAANGKTVAVLGTGLNVTYPRENQKLFEKIAEKGCLLSEFPPGTGPLPHHFPMRNRIIAGLSLGVIVVEAKEKSGALITARLAGEQGREVFAVPGKITSPLSQGTHRLIQDGAKLVQEVKDIFEELSIPLVSSEPQSQKPRPPLDKKESQLLDCIPDDGMAVEELLQKTELPPSQALAIVAQLELKEYIQRLPGQRLARRVRP